MYESIFLNAKSPIFPYYEDGFCRDTKAIIQIADIVTKHLSNSSESSEHFSRNAKSTKAESQKTYVLITARLIMQFFVLTQDIFALRSQFGSIKIEPIDSCVLFTFVFLLGGMGGSATSLSRARSVGPCVPASCGQGGENGNNVNKCRRPLTRD